MPHYQAGFALACNVGLHPGASFEQGRLHCQRLPLLLSKLTLFPRRACTLFGNGSLFPRGEKVLEQEGLKQAPSVGWGVRWGSPGKLEP